MGNSKRLLAIDAGNTLIKAALFENDALVEVKRFNSSSFDEVNTWIKKADIEAIVISSVLNKAQTFQLVEGLDNVSYVSHLSILPIKNLYESKETLGIDRLCNAVFAFKNKQGGSAVCIDIGTCIKFDVVNENGDYLGGSISPGIDLRYKSLHDYTGNLPLLSNKESVKLVGSNTETSIRSGVINGINAEIQQTMVNYEERFESLTFFVTGGDASSFDLHSKNDIFADENLTIKGLFEIHKHNA